MSDINSAADSNKLYTSKQFANIFLFDCVCSRDYLDSGLRRGLIWYDGVVVLYSGNSLLTKLKHSMLVIPLRRGSGKILSN